MALAMKHEDEGAGRTHVPVMVAEVCDLLDAHGPLAFVDATVGMGGHAEALLRGTRARLLGIDRDASVLEAARERLAEFGDRVTLRNGNFGSIGAIMRDAGFPAADGILADLGMSSFALDDPERGLSFRQDGPLDMRFDRSEALCAYDLVNEEAEDELARIIYTFGEERASRRIARTIVEARRRRRIETTGELRALVERALGPKRRGGMHPATRTFQALRIAVNREMESLGDFLREAPTMLVARGRLAVISYHSLEDRPVKERFRDLASDDAFTRVTIKVLRPGAKEIASNPRARSAKLRCLERNAP
jgi:16S rRNA (cytosine1402-N4)-methyltransferase